MIIHDCKQRSESWYEIKIGKFSSSNFSDIMPPSSKSLDSWTDTQLKSVFAIATQRMTGEVQNGYVSPAMQWGIDHEDEARTAYEFTQDCEVKQVGFVELNEWVGCSPDGLIGDDGLIEIKCPDSSTHLLYRVSPDDMVKRYHWQVQGQLYVTDRKWCDLVSFDPRFELEKQLKIIRVARDDHAISLLKSRLEQAIKLAIDFMAK
ncbi:MAG: YqaJ viral recombinase family protein [Candidatus Nanoarchaeia archaeon]|nr:YqaJ viral recombinase family protein [Candidatus Nanoarchaeia archaeon]